MKQVEPTPYKTDRINQYSGGKIEDATIPDYPPKAEDQGKLPNSFMTLEGHYIGAYAHGWWYFTKHMLVCSEYPHGVAVVLSRRADKILGLDITEPAESHMLGYYGYSHRAGNLFKIGDRLFEEEYEPIEGDYTEEQWKKFEKERVESATKALERKEYDTLEIALSETPMSWVVPYSMRGNVEINNMEQAKQAAKNMSSYLS